MAVIVISKLGLTDEMEEALHFPPRFFHLYTIYDFMIHTKSVLGLLLQGKRAGHRAGRLNRKLFPNFLYLGLRVSY